MPTHLISRHLQDFARWLRNQESYDDWEYATEPIPGDQTWIKDKEGCKKDCKLCKCKIEKEV